MPQNTKRGIKLKIFLGFSLAVVIYTGVSLGVIDLLSHDPIERRAAEIRFLIYRNLGFGPSHSPIPEYGVTIKTIRIVESRITDSDIPALVRLYVNAESYSAPKIAVPEVVKEKGLEEPMRHELQRLMNNETDPATKRKYENGLADLNIDLI